NAASVTRRIDRTNVLGTLTGSFELLDGLRIHTAFGPQYTVNNDGQFVGIYTRAKRGQGAPDATLRETQNTNYTLSNFLDLDRTYGGKHHVQATALYEVARFRTTFDSAAALALPFENQLWYNLGTGSTPTVNGFFSQTELQSWMGRVNYTLLPRALPYSSGYSSVLQNVGATKNLGLEFSVSTVNLRNWHKLGWATDFNISTNRNRIVRLQSGLTADVGSLRWVGQPINVYYDYKYIGL